MEPPLPPIYEAQPGRPRKLRKRGIDETTKKEPDSRKHTLLKASRKGRKKKCGSCKNYGAIVESSLVLWKVSTLKFNNDQPINKSKKKALLHLVN